MPLRGPPAAFIGAHNVLDEYPPIDKNNWDNTDNTIGNGNIHATSSPFGFEGGFWYFRLRADFE